MLVEASLDSGSTFPLLLSDSLTNTSPGSYVQTKLALPTILTSSNAVKFRWRVVPDSLGSAGTLRIDDISVTVRHQFDLMLDDLRFIPLNPVEDDSVSAIAKIKNPGQQSAENFSAEFYVDMNNDTIPQPAELRATVVHTRPLAPSDSVELVAGIGLFPAGSHIVIAKVVHPPDQNPGNNQRHAALHVGYPPRSVVINEIMYAPTSPEPEWMELHNTRADSISVKNWLVADSNRVFRTITTQETKIPPSGYAVLTGNPSAFINIHPNVLAPIIGVTSFPSLNNSGDAVILYDQRGVAMDSVRYVASWGGNTGGRSLERIDPFDSSHAQSNWGTSRSPGRSTPGERNSLSRKDRDLALDSMHSVPLFPVVGDTIRIHVRVRNIGRESIPSFSVSLFHDADADSLMDPGELLGTILHPAILPPLDSAVLVFDVGTVIASRLMIARADFPADEDTSNNIRFGAIVVGYPPGSVRINEIMYAPMGTEPEWVELFNTRADSVDMKGWLISDNVVTTKRIITDKNVKIPPAGYAVLARDSAALLDIHPTITARVINVVNLPTLNNSGDAVVVYDSRSLSADSAVYLSSWGGGNGHSLERVDVVGSSTAQSNWGTSRNPAGSTPGRLNSIARKDRDLAADTLTFSPPQPVAGDTLTIRVHVRNPGRVAAPTFAVELYRDANNDSLAQPGELAGSGVWPGPLAPLDSAIVSVVIHPAPAGRQRFIAKVLFVGDEDTTNNMRSTRIVVGYPPGSVRINEIMYAPSGGIPEWIEVMNTSADTADLAGWFLGNRSPSSRYEITDSLLLLAPYELFVIAKDTALLRTAYGYREGRYIQVPSLPTFLWNNSADAVVLSDIRRRVIDSVFYSSAWGGNGGKSLERIDVLADPHDSTNWATSTDSLGATPARPNANVLLDHDLRAVRILADTVAPGGDAHLRVVVRNVGRHTSSTFALRLYDDLNGDSSATPDELFHEQSTTQPIVPRDSVVLDALWPAPSSGVHRLIAFVHYEPDQRQANNTVFGSVRVGFGERSLAINEIMYAPLTGAAEYVELFNAGPDSVNVAQWKVRDRRSSTGVNEFSLSSTSKIVRPGEYFVLASDSSILRMTGVADERLMTILNVSSLSLNNEGDDVVLVDPSGFVIDSVTYAPSWHNPNVADHTGRSLEKINPALPSNDRRNWSTCARPAGGTPGAQNSLHATVLPSRSKLTVSPNPFSPDGDGWEDFAIIQYELSIAVSLIRVRLYDVAGRRIRTLANSEPSGTRGSLVWDGLDDEQQKARVGVYIILLEAIDDAGGVLETVKGVVVLAARL